MSLEGSGGCYPIAHSTKFFPIMTQDHSLTLLKIPGEIFINSKNSHRIITFLTERLNTGYDKVKLKYGVILSTRIKNEAAFVNDLGIKSSGSFLWLLIARKDHDPSKTIEFLQNGSFIRKEADGNLSFEELEQKQILGTIGVKPRLEKDSGKLGWEITGFTSFLKGVGKFLLENLETLAVKEGVLDFLFASVIQEHELVPYYAKYGFEPTGVVHLLEIDDSGKVKGGALEDGIYATRNFHVAELEKQLK